MSFSTVFQSYQDDDRLLMKGCLQWTSFYGWEDFASSGDQIQSTRSVGQRLIHWATGAPIRNRKNTLNVGDMSWGVVGVIVAGSPLPEGFLLMSPTALPISPFGKFDFGVVSSKINIKMLNLIVVNLQFLWWNTRQSNFNGSNISGFIKTCSRQR